MWQSIVPLVGLWRHISRRRRLQLLLLLPLTLLASMLEAASIAIAMPFFGVLTEAQKTLDTSIGKAILQFFTALGIENIAFGVTALFCAILIATGTSRLVLVYVNNQLALLIGTDLSSEMYLRTLYQPYETHCNRNSSDVANVLINSSAQAINAVLMVVTLTSSFFLAAAILVALFFASAKVAVLTFGIVGVLYLIIIWLTGRILVKNGRIATIEAEKAIKCLQEGLGGIRDVLLNHAQTMYGASYRNADFRMRKAYANNLFISSFPRLAIESLGMIVIVSVSYLISLDETGRQMAIPILGAIAIGAQRMLPVMQQAYTAWSTIRAAEAPMMSALALLNQEIPTHLESPSKISNNFKKSIELREVSFTYSSGGSVVLKSVNLLIPKGGRIGIIGKTGSGKSTLIDLIMGLLLPTSGQILVDDVQLSPENLNIWQSQLAHVPQSIFLTDQTIAENIAFGVSRDQIDHSRIRRAAQCAQIDDLINSWPDKYETLVGERGVRLSGGQRQRIGIARALYRNAGLIVLDEATSALDGDTEDFVMRAIESINPDVTLIVVAHRLTTLKNCSHILELKNGDICRSGSYSEIVERK